MSGERRGGPKGTRPGTASDEECAAPVVNAILAHGDHGGPEVTGNAQRQVPAPELPKGPGVSGGDARSAVAAPVAPRPRTAVPVAQVLKRGISRKGIPFLEVRCPYCRKRHTHGASGPGVTMRRLSHCRRDVREYDLPPAEEVGG